MSLRKALTWIVVSIVGLVVVHYYAGELGPFQIFAFLVVITPSIFGIGLIRQFFKQRSNIRSSTKHAKLSLIAGVMLILVSCYFLDATRIWYGKQPVLQQWYWDFFSQRELKDLSDTYFQPSTEYTLVEQRYNYHYDLPGAESLGKSLKSKYTFEDKEYTLQQYVGSAEEIDMCGDKPRVVPAGSLRSASPRSCEFVSSKFGNIRVDIVRWHAEIKAKGKALYASTPQSYDDKDNLRGLVEFINSLEEVPSSKIHIKSNENP